MENLNFAREEQGNAKATEIVKHSEDHTNRLFKFLADAGIASAGLTPLSGDASARRYFRVDTSSGRFLLMDASATINNFICDPDDSAEDRKIKGYDGLARRSCCRVEAFASISDWLRRGGIYAPEVLAIDKSQGFALVEEIPGPLISELIDQGSDVSEAYSDAVQVLQKVRRLSIQTKISWRSASWDLLEYDELAFISEASLFLDWYLEKHKGISVSQGQREEWAATWSELLAPVIRNNRGLVMRDYHSPNLILTPNKWQNSSLGVLDFQDALIGNVAFDLVSLVEDPRRPMGSEMRQALIDQYQRSSGVEFESLSRDISVLGAQRSFKLLGIFVRLAMAEQKNTYVQYLNNVIRNLRTSLLHDATAPLRKWIALSAD